MVDKALGNVVNHIAIVRTNAQTIYRQSLTSSLVGVVRESNNTSYTVTRPLLKGRGGFREFYDGIIVEHGALCCEEVSEAAGGLGPGARALIVYLYLYEDTLYLIRVEPASAVKLGYVLGDLAFMEPRLQFSWRIVRGLLRVVPRVMETRETKPYTASAKMTKTRALCPIRLTQ